VCEQLAQSLYSVAKRPEIELATFPSLVRRPNHYTKPRTLVELTAIIGSTTTKDLIDLTISRVGSEKLTAQGQSSTASDPSSRGLHLVVVGRQLTTERPAVVDSYQRQAAWSLVAVQLPVTVARLS